MTSWKQASAQNNLLYQYMNIYLQLSIRMVFKAKNSKNEKVDTVTGHNYVPSPSSIYTKPRCFFGYPVTFI